MKNFEEAARNSFWALHQKLKNGPVKEIDVMRYLFRAINPELLPEHDGHPDQVAHGEAYKDILEKWNQERAHPQETIWCGLGKLIR